MEFSLSGTLDLAHHADLIYACLGVDIAPHVIGKLGAQAPGVLVDFDIQRLATLNDLADARAVL